MRDKYYDPEGWKLCTLRYNIELGQRLWLLCGTCRKSRYFDTAEWAKKHNIDLDTPFKSLGKAIRVSSMRDARGVRPCGALQ